MHEVQLCPKTRKREDGSHLFVQSENDSEARDALHFSGINLSFQQLARTVLL